MSALTLRSRPAMQILDTAVDVRLSACRPRRPRVSSPIGKGVNQRSDTGVSVSASALRCTRRGAQRVAALDPEQAIDATRAGEPERGGQVLAGRAPGAQHAGTGHALLEQDAPV